VLRVVSIDLLVINNKRGHINQSCDKLINIIRHQKYTTKSNCKYMYIYRYICIFDKHTIRYVLINTLKTISAKQFGSLL